MCKHKILYVEDEVVVLLEISKDLEAEGYEVKTAAGGDKAIKLLEKESFDLVITDVVMGEVDGFEVVKKAKELCPETITMILTGYEETDFAIKALRLGVDDYMLKPYETEELLFRVQRCLEKGELLRKKKQAEEALRESEERYRNIFQNALVSLWEEDLSKVRLAIDDLKAEGVKDFRKYVDEHPEFVQQAIKMIKVIDVNDATVKLYGAREKEELLGSLDKVATQDSLSVFKEEIIAIAEGKKCIKTEVIGQTLQGARLDLLIKLTIPSDLKSRHFIARSRSTHSAGTSSTSFLNRSFWVLVISVRTLL